ncbi:hypothetical protein AVEN_105152-1 [Araneus ventricosus]|uniref:Uncharacterized protein n=1 Tax=Araneus ventricosus TaxID=182803 RepID=A0A4Y2VYQ0_ARAVE|nr:hypothetical protein AVEN_47149-1 [Araneus ventricosus]GBO30573.1 hypothetical protein AVEN_105152-1 [Araneus ventricosus]
MHYQKIRSALVDFVEHSAAPSYVMYISQYPPPKRGNSSCLMVKMLDWGHKGTRSKTTHCQSGDPEEHAKPTFSPRNKWQHQKSITSIPSSAAFNRGQHYNFYSNAALPIQSL